LPALTHATKQKPGLSARSGRFSSEIAPAHFPLNKLSVVANWVAQAMLCAPLLFDETF
jgi:hypothetical protein